MRHLYNSRCEVLRLDGELSFGSPKLSWTKLTHIVDPLLGTPGEILGRFDLNFMRPGKDQPMPIVAGRAPDRFGVFFFDVTDLIKAGDRIRALDGPIVGTFEIKAIPDPAVGFTAAHHMEVQVVEVTRNLTNVFPGGNVEERITQ